MNPDLDFPRRWSAVLPWLVLFVQPAAGAPAKPLHKSPLVDVRTPGHAVAIDTEVPEGARKLFLVVTDGGNGFAADWAVWVDPVVRGVYGEKKLTDLEWVEAQAAWGEVVVGKNSAGGPLRVAGQGVHGIAAHAVSMIEYDLPPGTTGFSARGALDEGGTSQGGSSVVFQVYTERPRMAARSGGGGGARDPEAALAGLTAADGLVATTFAHEPMLLSPSAIDVDARGRVWVAEIVNYRGHNGKRPEGDRILILEDRDGDGRAEASKVFFQSREIDSPHGVCVLGNTVLVSANGAIHRLIDTDGDDRADVHEKLFTGIGGAQHDHGAHQVMFGPDGRLYFNVGNDGGQIRDKDGKPITDLAGNVISQDGKPYQQGLVFRCEPDGSRVETLGWNFRNNWEVTVDSFGTIWQSDNDDDGNQGVRINFVMEFGNYGYRDEFTGAGWGENRTNIEPEIPRRHWHLNDPGVVPNLIQTGAGSPTGIMVYEGSLLPAVYQNQVIHCDAGPNIVRAYPVERAGAGWSARMENILEGTEDKWFRPSDVVAAPDGSLVVADWYDPGVGGHGMGDLEHGRIYRIAPSGAVVKTPTFDFKTPDGAAEALKSPALSARYLAYTALGEFGAKAEPALLTLWHDPNPRYRARALWLLGQLDAPKAVEAAINDNDPDIRVTGLRLARRLQRDVIPLVARLVDDPSAHVRRECAIALRHSASSDAPRLWAALARQHDGADRWYLEALGIGADRQWDAFLDAWIGLVGGEEKLAASPATRDIVWRSRAARSPALIARLILAPETPGDEQLRYLRALDFQLGEGKAKALQSLVEAVAARADGGELMALVLGKLPAFDAGGAAPGVKAALDRFLAAHEGTDEYFEYIGRFNLRDRVPQLVAHVQSDPEQKAAMQSLRQLVGWGEMEAVDRLVADAGARAPQVLGALGVTGQRAAVERLERYVVAGPPALRVPAVTALGRSRGGEQALLALAKADRLSDDASKLEAGRVLGGSRDESIRHQATQVLASMVKIPEGVALPPITELAARTGDAEGGREVFTLMCATCHQVGSEGIAFGPALTEIGSKLPKEGLLASIIDPNQGISFGYEGWTVETKDGTTLVGLITSETDNSITMRAVGGLDSKIEKDSITKREKMSASLMTALAPAMTEKQLVDLVEYLAALRKK
jgi:putative membrane-bound dehydrogenase-like protein